MPIAVSLMTILLQAGGARVRDWLAWDRAALSGGEAWRLVSGHFVHLGWTHLLLNLAGLLLVWSLVGRNFDRWRWGIVAVTSIITMDVGFWLFYPALDWYVGLSGLLHGLLVAGLVVGLQRRDRESLVLAAFVIGKLGWEQFSGPLPGSEATSGGAVIVDAHLYGALGGILGAMLARYNPLPGGKGT